MTRSIAADLERRGFIVYVTVFFEEEEHIVQSENRSDIRALHLDLTTVSYDCESRDNRLANIVGDAVVALWDPSFS